MPQKPSISSSGNEPAFCRCISQGVLGGRGADPVTFSVCCKDMYLAFSSYCLQRTRSDRQAAAAAAADCPAGLLYWVSEMLVAYQECFIYTHTHISHSASERRWKQVAGCRLCQILGSAEHMVMHAQRVRRAPCNGYKQRIRLGQQAHQQDHLDCSPLTGRYQGPGG